MRIKEHLRHKQPGVFAFLKKGKNDLIRVVKPAGDRAIYDEPISESMGCERGTPIDRYYIEKFLSDNIADITGNLLEIADDSYSRKYSDMNSTYNIITFDKTKVNPMNNVYFGDLTDLPGLDDLENKFDCFICTQTLNFIYDVNLAVRGILKVLKPGGVALITVSGLSQVSPFDYERWGDFWRFTDKSMYKLFKEQSENNIVDVKSYGNYKSAQLFLHGMTVEDLTDKSILDETDMYYQIILGLRVQKG